MSVTSIDKDFDSLTLTLVADFDAPAERVWELWADPRQLERWWGPPTYPATMEEHDLTPGGRVDLLHDRPGGRDVPRLVAGHVGRPADVPGVHRRVRRRGRDADRRHARRRPCSMQLTEHDGGTRMELRSTFDSREQMEQLLSMGMDEGLQQAVGQMDALLAA